MKELKPCPFCGGEAIIDPDDNCACCLNITCMIQPKVVIDGYEGIEYWNRRLAK